MKGHSLAIVGAGLIGAAAARHAAGMTDGVVVIGPDEPAELARHPGPFASHYDSGRITRHLDPSEAWAELAARSIAQYRVIAAESGMPFHRGVGVVWADGARRGLADLAAAAERHKAPLEAVDAGEASKRFGWVLSDYPDLGFEGPPAGHIDPRAMRRAQLIAAERRGAAHLADTVVAVTAHAGGITLRLASAGVVRTEAAIVAAGAYSGMLLAGVGPRVPITPVGVAVLKAEVAEAAAAKLADMPALICRTRAGDTVDVYAVPPVRYPDGRWYLKLGVETLPELELSDAEAIRNWMAGSAPGWRDHLVDRLERLLPDLAAASLEVIPCVYSRTPTHHPYVDVVAPRLVVAAGGNGRAAKSADAIGSLAARLALTDTWDGKLNRATFALPTGDDVSVSGGGRIRRPFR